MEAEEQEKPNFDGINVNSVQATTEAASVSPGVPQGEAPQSIFNEATPQKPEKKPKRRLILLLVLLFLLFVAASLGTWYYLSQQNSMKSSAPVAVNITTTTSTTKAPETVPANFKKITLNGVDVYYPSSWGAVAEQKVTKETPGTNDNPMWEYTGENARFGNNDPGSVDYYIAGVQVNEKASYDHEPNTKAIMDYLEIVYKEKKVDPEDLFALSQTGYLPPGFSMYNKVYNPRYFESKDGKWRGYWYVNGTGNGTVPNPGIMIVMYDKDNGKVISIHSGLRTAKNEVFVKTQPDSNNAAGTQKWQTDMENYFKTAYTKDPELKAKVDDELLKMCSLLK